VAWCASDKSKRNNVFEVTTALFGITILLQDSDQVPVVFCSREYLPRGYLITVDLLSKSAHFAQKDNKGLIIAK
jgi:hypothetical protein